MQKNFFPFVFLLLLSVNCKENPTTEEHPTEKDSVSVSSTSLIVLGTIQDGGSPHIGCDKECCKDIFDNPDEDRQVVSLGLFDSETKKKYLFEARPDLSMKIKELKIFGVPSESEMFLNYKPTNYAK